MIKEFCCIAHGYFEGSHPICPHLGCDSSEVTQVFLTAPKIMSGKTKRFDVGIRRSSDLMRINNFRSAKEGETSFAGRAEDAPLGMELLWGNDVQRKMGKNFSELTTAAQQPLSVRTGRGVETLTQNNAIADLATTAGITKRVLPRAAEVVASDKSEGAKAKALT